jgi:hypothetical protein
VLHFDKNVELQLLPCSTSETLTFPLLLSPSLSLSLSHTHTHTHYTLFLTGIDPDTPEEAKKLTSEPIRAGWPNDQEREFHLVFSDEFESEGRTLHDGRDPRWTALHGDDLTNNPLHWYR